MIAGSGTRTPAPRHSASGRPVQRQHVPGEGTRRVTVAPRHTRIVAVVPADNEGDAITAPVRPHSRPRHRAREPRDG